MRPVCTRNPFLSTYLMNTTLVTLGLRQNTLILFVGDNGTGRGTRSQMAGREVIGGKGTTTAAGMHVPLIASWPARIPPGQVIQDLVDTTDFLPTLCEAAGVKPPPDLKPDGRSFLPQLQGRAGTPREWLYSWYSPRQGNDRNVREFAFTARYKLYRDGSFFDLGQDQEEKHPLKIGDLAPLAAQAARKLQDALDHFKNARPASRDAEAGATR